MFFFAVKLGCDLVLGVKMGIVDRLEKAIILFLS
jgi:hypothetical protein